MTEADCEYPFGLAENSGKGELYGEIKSFLRSRQPVNLIIAAANILVFLVLSFWRHGKSCVMAAAPGQVLPRTWSRESTTGFLRVCFCTLAWNIFLHNLVLIFLGDARGGWKKFAICDLSWRQSDRNVVSVLIEIQRADRSCQQERQVLFFRNRCACIYCAEKPRNLGIYSGKAAGTDGSTLDPAEHDGDQRRQQCTHIGGFAAGFVLAFLLGAEKRRVCAHRFC